MALQSIDLGAPGTGAGGDTARSAFEKVNENFASLGTAALRNAIGAGDVFARGGILGTVSQVSGVPTGAIIQRGSNASGEFIRFANGTQECYGAFITGTISASNYVDAQIVYPVPFAVDPTVPLGIIRPYATYDFQTYNTFLAADFNGVTFRLGINGLTAQQFIVSWRAIGRWF